MVRWGGRTSPSSFGAVSEKEEASEEGIDKRNRRRLWALRRDRRETTHSALYMRVNITRDQVDLPSRAREAQGRNATLLQRPIFTDRPASHQCQV